MIHDFPFFRDRRKAGGLLAFLVCGAKLLAGEPLWAYGVTTAVKPGERAPHWPTPAVAIVTGYTPEQLAAVCTIPGASTTYTLAQIRNGNEVVDWFPAEHPPLSALQRHGPASLGKDAYGCAFCHGPLGHGKPENANVADLSAGYVIRQLLDMRQGLRVSADPRKANTPLMVALAQAMSEAEIAEAARYIAALPRVRWVRVVETPFVPTTEPEAGMFVVTSEGLTEPIGRRIIEVAESRARTRLRDPHSGFVAYVPPGSLGAGKALVTTGARAGADPVKALVTVGCASCHGPNLEGVGDVPGIAGRSPDYLARQLYDFQQGTRRGAQSATMQLVCAKLADDDFIAIAAYVASLEPLARK
jgi:cytochrome c553